MAYRRCIVARTKSFYQQQQRLAPSFSHFSTGDREELHTDCISRNSELRSYIHNRFLMTGNNRSNFKLSRNVFQLRRSEIGAGYWLISHRNLSSASGGERVPFEIEILNNAEVLNDTVSVLGDKTVEAAPVVNEVAVAAANSFPPVAALQYLVDYVHCYTGFNWWASIVVTTLLYRFMNLPLQIQKEKFYSKYSETFVGPLLLTFKKLLSTLPTLDGCSSTFKEGLPILLKLVKLGKIPILGKAVSIAFMWSFFFAILNMAEKVPSFMNGGTLWFTDLTTSDRIHLPIFLGFTVWLNLKSRSTHHGKGVSITNMFLGALAFLGAATVGFPNAMYCYWITSNLFSIAYSTAKPQVQKLLGMPLMPPSADKKPAETSSKPSMSSSTVDRRRRKGEKRRK